jgi:hypothetical protein
MVLSTNTLHIWNSPSQADSDRGATVTLTFTDKPERSLRLDQVSTAPLDHSRKAIPTSVAIRIEG